jgi:thiamine biosynthesis lipoprotein
VSDRAVCTSGNYERRASDHDVGHLINPIDGDEPTALVSATVVAPSAMLADALATAAFVLGPDDGRRLLDDHGVCGLLVTSDFDRFVTQGCGSDAIVFT